MLDKLKKSSFDPHLQSKFEVHPEGMDKMDVELVEVTESFSVIFRVAKDKEFGQGTYKVKHAKMGEFDLFMVPIVYGKPDGICYQAVFSRLLKDNVQNIFAEFK